MNHMRNLRGPGGEAKATEVVTVAVVVVVEAVIGAVVATLNQAHVSQSYLILNRVPSS